jgi:glycine/D-amino acid oxidase-like deaminating enzyme
MKKTDVIIVGQGISGAVLSAEMLLNNINVLVIDEGLPNTSSKVSAGLYNPIVFKRVVKSWMIDELNPAAITLYKKMEELTVAHFFYEREILKVFVNEEEKLQWLNKCEQPDYQPYLANEIKNHCFNNAIQPHNGLATVKQAANVDVKTMLYAWQKYLQQQHIFIQEKFNHSDLIITNNGVEWKGIAGKFIVFCEGYKAMHNPYFSYLPFVPTKGELLTVKIPQLDTNQVINKGVFILPLGDNLYRVGATYQWDTIDENITPNAREELSEKLKKVLACNFEIIDQQAGIRPSTKDRRPFIGASKNNKSIYIFNGMGTKAVLIAPYFSKALYNHLYNQIPLPNEVDISRYAGL